MKNNVIMKCSRKVYESVIGMIWYEYNHTSFDTCRIYEKYHNITVNIIVPFPDTISVWV